MALVPGTRLGPYEVVAPLGAGGMGEVYRARDTRLDRTVAIKLLPPRVAHDPERRARFEREAKTISSLNHPHICTLFDVGEEQGSHYLVMELLEGESLADRLQRGPLPLDQVVKYGAQVADALDCAHKQGIVHRDLKPGNVVLTRSGAKLLDFGLARSTAEASLLPGPEDQATEAKPLTAAGTVLGTYQYMAPEQLAGAEAGPRTDIFALGTVLYEMATGRRAFEGKSKTSLVAAILSAQPAPISSLQADVPQALDHVVRKCLEKEPDDRWQSAHDVASELRWIAETGSQAGGPATVTVRRRARERLAWALAGVGVIVSLAIVAWALTLARGTRTAADPAVIRFLVFPPPGTQIAPGPAAPQAAVSPDGRLLTFAASAEDGTRRLWVRPLDALEARLLPGSEGADLPFWSPDGRFIGFFADGKLKTIAAAVGPPEVLCDAPYAQGGAWSPSGIILFAAQRHGALMRVPATGGDPVPATTLDSSRQEIAHWFPQFLPDGRRFLYLVRARQESHQGLYASSLDSRETVRVLNTTVRAGYAGGHLLFVRAGTLLAQPFEAKELKLTGEAVPIAERMAYNPVHGRTNFSVSASGVLVYREGGVGGTTPTELAWFDRAGKRLGSVGEALLHIDMALSPDGRRLAVSRRDTRGGADIWLHELSRGTSSRLTADASLHYSPLWSPDGSRVVFSSDRNGPYDLYQRAASGAGEEELLARSSDDKVATDWSEDGRFIVYESGSGGGGPLVNPDLWLLPLSGDRSPTPLLRTGFSERGGKLSPDQRWLAYSSDDTGRPEVYVQPFPVSGAKWQVSTNGGSEPSWRGDGRELFFLSPDNRLMAVAVGAGGGFAAGVARPLFAVRVLGSEMRNHYAVSRDGRRFLVNTTTEEEAPRPIVVVVNWPAVARR